MNKNKYDGMGIFQEAKQRELDGMGYHARRFKILWQSKKCSWKYLMIEWGIRWSERWQILPIWNASHNNQRALMFGFWKLHFTIILTRKGSFNQNRPFISFRLMRKFYQLFG